MLLKPARALDPFYLGGPVDVKENILVCAAQDKLNVVNLETTSVVASFVPDTEQITAIALSMNRETVVVATRSLQIHIYSLDPPKRIASIPKAHEAPVMALAIDPTGTLIASGGAESQVKVWDMQKTFCTHIFKGHGGLISSLSFYGQLGEVDWRLASASEDSKVRVWDLAASKCIAVLDNHVSAVRGLTFSSNGSVLLSAGRDKLLSLYQNYELIASISTPEQVEAAGFIASRYIYCATPRQVLIYNLKGINVGEWSLPHEEADLIDARLLDNAHIFGILSDQTLIGFDFDAETGSIAPQRYLAGNHSEVIDMAIGPSNNLVLATNSQDVRVLGSDNGIEFTPLVGHSDIVICIDVLGNWLVSGSKDKTARLWNLTTGECVMDFVGHAGSIGAVSLSRSGKLPKFVLTGSQDLTIKKWDADGSATFTRKAHEKDINTIDVSKDDKRFATGSQDRSIKVWNTQTGDIVAVLNGHRRGVWSVKFAPENTLLSGSGDKTIRQWSLHDHTCLRTFQGHSNSILKVLVYNGSVASAGGDGLVKMWDIKSSECVATLDNHEDKVWSLIAMDDLLISGGGDGVVTFWQDFSEEERAHAEEQQVQQVEKQQELENCVRSEQWERAICLALELNQPMRLVKLFTSIAANNEAESYSGLVAVDEVISQLGEEHSFKLLERVRDWNTNVRTSLIAQRVLGVVLNRWPKERFDKHRVHEILMNILPYSQRHMTRTQQLLETSYTLDYALDQMALS